MAFEDLFIRVEKHIGRVKLDAVISESHESTSRVTSNPVEFGADISDNVVVEPVTLNIVAHVSDTPLGLAAFTQIVDDITGLFGSSTVENLTRSQTAYNAMEALKNSRVPIEIQTRLKLYKNMIITKLNTTQDKDSSRAVLLNITAKEVRIVNSEIVDLTAEEIKAGTPRQQAAPAEKKGRVEAITPTETVEKSTLKSITDWVVE